MSRTRTIFRRAGIAFIGWIFLLLVSSTSPPLLTQLIFRLPVGWIGFLGRVGPEITVSWPAVAMGILCSTLIVCGIQWLGSGLKRSLPNLPAGIWRWRWSISLYLFVWILFFAAIGITGFTHQLAWLLRSNEQIYVRREHTVEWISALKAQALILSDAGKDSRWDGTATRAAYFAEQPAGESGRNSLDEFHTIFLTDSYDRFIAGVVFHRDERKREGAGFILVERDRSSEVRPFAELNAMLARYAP